MLALLTVLALALAGCFGGGEPAESAAAGPDAGAGDAPMGDEGADAGDDVADADAATPPPPPVSLDVSTTGIYPLDPAFQPSSLSAASGAEVTVTLTNGDLLPLFAHEWVLEGVPGAATAAAAGGESVSVTFVAPEPGEYAFYCAVGDHRDRGMVGTFTVTA